MRFLLCSFLLVCVIGLQAQIAPSYQTSSLGQWQVKPAHIAKKNSDGEVKTNMLDNEKVEYYETTNYINYRLAKYDHDSVTTKRDALFDWLEIQSANPIADRNALNDSIIRLEAYETELVALSKKIDDEHLNCRKDYLRYEKSTVLRFGKRNSRAFYDLLYGNDGDRIKTLNSGGVSLGLGSQTGAVFSEIMSSSLWIFRISLGTMVSASVADSLENSTELEAVQRLSTYGGNTVLKLEYPLAYVHSKDNKYNFISQSFLKFSADLPAFGTTTTDFAGNGMAGIEFYGDAATFDDKFRIFADFDAGYYVGNSQFFDNLGLEGRSSFTFSQAKLGIAFNNLIKVSFILFQWSDAPELRNNKVVVGGEVL